MSGALDTVLEGTRVRIRTTLLPEYVYELDDKSPPGPLTTLLKPQLEIERGGVVLYRTAPYGEPQRPEWLVPAVLVAIAVLVVLVLG